MMSAEKAYTKYANLLISSLLLTVVGCIMGDLFAIYLMNPFITLLVSIGLLIGIRFVEGPLKRGLFFGFSFLEGVSLTPIISYYLAVDSSTLVSAITVTAIVVGVFLVLGTKAKNLAPLGRYLFAGLIGVLVFVLIELFFGLFIPISLYLGIAVFSGYISYNINTFKRHLDFQGGMTLDEVTDYVVSQYLNIINLFLDILRLMGRD